MGNAYNFATSPEGIHTALDAAGMVPFVGEAADAVNAALYLYEGDFANAALSGAGIIPGIGNYITAAKHVKKGAGAAKNGAKLVNKVDDARDISKSCISNSCFTAGTQIVVGMEYDENDVVIYDTVNIEDLQVGDLVYSYNTLTGEVELKAVTKTMELTSGHVRYITIKDENDTEQTIETTDSHPFWVVTDDPDLSRAARSLVDENGVWLYHENISPTENGFWVEAKDLRVGDVVLGANGELSVIQSTMRVNVAGGISVFNIEVEGNHNYFVLAKEFEYGQTCVLVHNACWDNWHPGSHGSPKASAMKHFKKHGKEVGATTFEEYCKMANAALDVVSGRFGGKRVSGASLNVKRFIVNNGEHYIDVIRDFNNPIFLKIVSFGKLW